MNNNMPNVNNNKPEIKKEDIKVVEGVRSAYSTPNKPNKQLSEDAKQKQIIKRRAEFEMLVKKAREEEKKRAIEIEKMRIQRQQKEKENMLKEQEELKKEQEEYKNYEQNSKKRSNGSINSMFSKKKTISEREKMELEAKQLVLKEQIGTQSNNNARFSKPIVFEYIAKNVDGEFEKSSIEALSRVDVYSFLEAEGYEIFDIYAKTNQSPINIQYKFKTSRLIFCLSQLSAYLKSGIALADSVKILDNQSKNLNEKKAWRAIYYDLSMGDKLSVSMEKRKNMFPKLLINMVKTAEMTGNLIETLDDMVEYYTESESTKKQMKSAMTYPIAVSLFALVVVIFILLYVIPQFVDIYKDMDAKIPGITKFVMNTSYFLQNNILYILLGILVLAMIFVYLYKNVRSFRKNIQEILMHVPVVKDIIIYNEVTMFSKTFANLINHNVFITDSMDILKKITDNEIYKKLIYDTAINLTKGEAISTAFKDHWAFPNVAYQMLITGEKTGRLGIMMEKVSEHFQELHKNIINQMKSLIEPVLIISLAVVVGGILLAVVIPMYGMFEGFGG